MRRAVAALTERGRMVDGGRTGEVGDLTYRLRKVVAAGRRTDADRTGHFVFASVSEWGIHSLMEEPHKHLKRLERVFPRAPVYFITVVQASRSPIFPCREFQSICEEVWTTSETLHGWSTGPYVIMPEHVHFFCRESAGTACGLSSFVGKWKEWTAKFAKRRLGFAVPLWQREFFDHLLRSPVSLSGKIDYAWFNPVRAGLVKEPEDWPYRGNPGKWETL